MYEFCKREVERELLAPGTARFPERNDPDLLIHVNQGSALVLGYVDSENAFGALLRSRFRCTYEQQGGEWQGEVAVYPD